MAVAEGIVNFVRGALKSYGPSNVKKRLWDDEFSGDKWNFIDNTAGDCVYSHLERHCHNGNILDLGCGPGNTANELDMSAYQAYVGVDISEAALVKARRRTEASGRATKNLFEAGDFINYKPKQTFNVILFRESIYHIPVGKIKMVLDGYSPYLTQDGVFVVRMNISDGHGNSKQRPLAMLKIIQSEFDVVEEQQYGESGAMVIVFRPKA